MDILSVASEHVTVDRNLEIQLFEPEESKHLSDVKMRNIKAEYELLETDFLYYLFCLLRSCLSYCPEEIDVFYSSDFIKNGFIINLLVLHPNSFTMKRVAEGIVEF